MLLGPDIVEQVVEVQYSDIVPYIKFMCSKNDIAETEENVFNTNVFITQFGKVLFSSKISQFVK